MRVTAAKIDPTINRLTNFLNFDFERGSEKRLKDVHLNFYELRDRDWRTAGKRLQKEIRLDLDRLLSGEVQLGLEGLDGLLDKISRLNLHFRWYAESPHHRDSVRLLGPERKIVKLGGRKFIVCRQLSPFESFRELFYGVIAESLENGSLSKLRICPECDTVFVAGDPKRRFCSDSCKDEFHNQSRIDRGYFIAWRLEKKLKEEKLNRQREELKRQTETKRDALRFHEFLLRAKAERNTGGPTARFIKHKVPEAWPIVTGWLKDHESGKEPQQIWKDVPVKTKAILKDRFEEERR